MWRRNRFPIRYRSDNWSIHHVHQNCRLCLHINRRCVLKMARFLFSFSTLPSFHSVCVVYGCHVFSTSIGNTRSCQGEFILSNAYVCFNYNWHFKVYKLYLSFFFSRLKGEPQRVMMSITIMQQNTIMLSALLAVILRLMTFGRENKISIQ